MQNASFDHVTPEEFLNKYELLDARLLELEGKVKGAVAALEAKSLTTTFCTPAGEWYSSDRSKLT